MQGGCNDATRLTSTHGRVWGRPFPHPWSSPLISPRPGPLRRAAIQVDRLALPSTEADRRPRPRPGLLHQARRAGDQHFGSVDDVLIPGRVGRRRQHLIGLAERSVGVRIRRMDHDAQPDLPGDGVGLAIGTNGVAMPQLPRRSAEVIEDRQNRVQGGALGVGQPVPRAGESDDHGVALSAVRAALRPQVRTPRTPGNRSMAWRSRLPSMDRASCSVSVATVCVRTVTEDWVGASKRRGGRASMGIVQGVRVRRDRLRKSFRSGSTFGRSATPAFFLVLIENKGSLCRWQEYVRRKGSGKADQRFQRTARPRPASRTEVEDVKSDRLPSL